MAGLQEAFRSAAAAAFSAAGDIKESATFRSKTNMNPVYDPVTDTETQSYTDYSTSMVPSGYDSREIDGINILDTDERVKILVEELTPIPKRNDQIIRSSIKWEIINIHKDPANAVWTLQIRKP
jgi:hypothetical protein